MTVCCSHSRSVSWP